jgi:hypothetical protein
MFLRRLLGTLPSAGFSEESLRLFAKHAEQ